VLARAEDPADRAAAPVRGQVDLGAQPAAGPAQRLPARPGRQACVLAEIEALSLDLLELRKLG